MQPAQEQEMILNADVCAAILVVGRDYRLVALDGTPIPDPTDPAWKDARFVGCVAFSKGRVGVSLEEELATEDMRVLSAAFIQLVTTKLAEQHTQDAWAESMRRLWTLPDTREN